MMLSQTSKSKAPAEPDGAPPERCGAGKHPRVTAAERRRRIMALWAKAQAAARSARLLGDAGDADGARAAANYGTSQTMPRRPSALGEMERIVATVEPLLSKVR